MLTAALLALLNLHATLGQPRDSSSNVRNLPITELRAAHPSHNTLTIILSGDGGWADIDQRVGERLQARGIDVIGLDMRDYLRNGRRSPAGIGDAVSRIARRYTALWQQGSVALVGYSRGADLAPFAAVNMGADVRPRLTFIGMLTLLERASFVYHFTDLWRMTSSKGDVPVLPQIQQLKGIPIVCIYGKEEPESLCRTAPPGLMTVIAREGKHHFDGNYAALADIIYDGIVRTETRSALSPAEAAH